MNIKKNIRKAGVGLLVSAVAISGAFAWLTNSDTATKQNNISVGSTSIIFENQRDVINLRDNDAIPMTKEYAIEHLTAYTFDIANTGNVHLDYTISIDTDSYSNTFDEGKINVLIAPIADDATTEQIKSKLSNATVQRLSAGKDLTASNLVGLTHQRYALIAYVDKATTLAEYDGNSVSFKLRVDAIQHNAISGAGYSDLEKSQIATTITAGGDTKNVEVYNIEGESKTDLLNKLQASGLTETADVDAIVEVCGDDYDGMNSTATFDVSSIANPGDNVIILHFNEETQEWEYIGKEVVGEDNTVTGNFTSYSPVAFIVNAQTGYTQKIYDPVTKMLIKTIEYRADGTQIVTTYDTAGDISNQEVIGSSTPSEAENVGPLVALMKSYMRNADSTYLDTEAMKDFMIENDENFDANNFRLYEGNVYKFDFVNVDNAEDIVSDWYFTTPDERIAISVERYNEEGAWERAGMAWGFADDTLPGTRTGQKFSEVVVGEDVSVYGQETGFRCTGIYKASGTLDTSGNNFYRMVALDVQLITEDEFNNQLAHGTLSPDNGALYTGRAYKYEVEGLTFYTKLVNTLVVIGENEEGNKALMLYQSGDPSRHPVGSTFGNGMTVIYSGWVTGTEVQHY